VPTPVIRREVRLERQGGVIRQIQFMLAIHPRASALTLRGFMSEKAQTSTTELRRRLFKAAARFSMILATI
jgi:hypothetical protein